MSKQAKPQENSEPVNHRTRVGQQRRARTEAQIIRAALRVFAEKGPDATVIDDVIKAADIARGTFYNYFRSIDELLSRASTWLVEDFILNFIEPLLDIDMDPAERFGAGIRLVLQKAQSDREWCQYVSRLGVMLELEQPAKDLRRGIRTKVFNVPSFDAAFDLQRGTVRQAISRIGAGDCPKNYPEHIAAIVLQGLGVDQDKIARVLAQPLPKLVAGNSDAGT